MSNGICVVAQNNKDTDYIRQAYALALSVLKFNPNTNVSLITTDDVDAKYKKVFDKIIDVPWGDLADGTDWKIDNRWKVYHCTPYRNTLVFDADMLILENIDHVWENCDDLIFTGNVKTFRDELMTSNYYRKTFTANNLPNVYSAMYKFSKCDQTKAFFIMLEMVMRNYKMFFKKYASKSIQTWNSVDVAAAIALKVLGKEKEAIDSTGNFTFTHLKHYIQNFNPTHDSWTKMLSVDLGDEIVINGYKQKRILHYVEDDFLSNDVLQWLEERV